ncbi:hypothetical protein ABEF91_007382 [Exophiala dermatitidis]
MAENRYRPSSYADPRASTGMVFSSSFDPRYYAQPRSGFDSVPASRHGSVYATQGVARKTYLDDHHPGGGSTIRTEYTVRPRHNSTVGSESRRPVSTVINRHPSPPRVRPTVLTTSARDDPRSPAIASAGAGGERYLVPAASHSRHHHRHSSATGAEQDRLGPAKSQRQPEYHRRGGYNAPLQDEGFSYTTPKEHFLQESSRPPQRRGSYSRRERPTSVIGLPEYRAAPRRDVPPPSSTRALDRVERSDPYRTSAPRLRDYDDRPAEIVSRTRSMRAPVVHQYRDDDYPLTREERNPRIAAKRHDRIDDDDRILRARYRDERDREGARALPRESERVRDRDRDLEREREREKEREREIDRERTGDRDQLREIDRNIRGPDDRRPPRSREVSPEHSGPRKSLATAAGLAAAGALAGAAVKSAKKTRDESENDDKGRRHRRRRRHHADDETSPDELASHVERDLTLNDGERAPHDRRRDDRKGDGAESERDDQYDRRRRHRRRHKDRARDEDESESTEDSGGRGHHGRKYEKEREGELREPSDVRRERTPSRDGPREAASSSDKHTSSPLQDEDTRPRRVQLVEPVEKKEEFKPKGILKPPREVPFPEDPNPEREGVAPLKDATKDGIPPNARWTKISRALVNPEALEKAHERFEERDDYVIVLRVISREEIMKLAEKTKEIREARERQWQAELERQRRRPREARDYKDENYDTDDEDRPRLAIDQAPPIQGDPRAYFAQQQQQLSRDAAPVSVNIPGQPGVAAPQVASPVAAPPPSQSQQMPIPDIRVESDQGNYIAKNG